MTLQVDQTVLYYDDCDLRQSTALEGIYYDRRLERAYVAFHESLWSYDLSPSIWRAWCESSSLGRFYSTYIRGVWSSRPLDPDAVLLPRPREVTTESIFGGDRYTFTGTVTTTITETVEVNSGPDSLERALAAFRASHENINVTKIEGN